jgi:hypothetical protein
MPTRCTATTAAGRACRAWAVRGSDPPRCRVHREGTKDEGRTTDGALSADELATDDLSTGDLSTDDLSAQIDDLDARIARLGAYVDARREELEVGDLVRLLDLHSRMLERVTRMRQVQNALEGKKSVLVEAIHRVLDKLSEREGVPL